MNKLVLLSTIMLLGFIGTAYAQVTPIIEVYPSEPIYETNTDVTIFGTIENINEVEVGAVILNLYKENIHEAGYLAPVTNGYYEFTIDKSQLAFSEPATFRVDASFQDVIYGSATFELVEPVFSPEPVIIAEPVIVPEPEPIIVIPPTNSTVIPNSNGTNPISTNSTTPVQTTCDVESCVDECNGFTNCTVTYIAPVPTHSTNPSLVCHNGVLISVIGEDLRLHVGHGDQANECPVIVTNSTTVPTPTTTTSTQWGSYSTTELTQILGQIFAELLTR